MSKTTSAIILLLALLFSHVIIFNFNLSGGFAAHGIKFQLLPIVEFTASSRAYTVLTSAVLGYILFTVFLITNYQKAVSVTSKSFYTALFFCSAAVLFEVYTFILDYSNSYTGQYLRVGLILAIMCLKVFDKIYREEKQTEEPEENVS